MEDVTILSIAELIKRGLPLTGTFNLHQSPPPFNPILVQSFNSNPTHTSSSISESSPNPKILTPLKHPSIIIGTLNLPSSSCRCPNDNCCFQFSDSSATICCDILDLDIIRMLGKRIRVFSWNFIPLRNGGGFLEIINWGFFESLPQCSHVDQDPVFLDSGTVSLSDGDLKARYCVHGVLECVGPVTIVPCSVGHRNLQGDKHLDSSGHPKNLQGFMVQIMVCECKLCTSRGSIAVLDDDTHSFVNLKIAYLCGSASYWHPVLPKYVGRVITFWGLKKKMISIGKAEPCLMYVSSEKSSMQLSGLSRIRLPRKKIAIKGKGECGSYSGVVKGVYMQGMLLELDNEVWLLLTDQLLSPPHSVRVGAIVSVRNVHFVNSRFPWAKLLILGACVKTSISVQLFSPLVTECHVISQSRSMLGKLIETLPFSARLWVLLLISSFRKMFAGVLSEKEILGSKHKEGLVQMYAKSHLPLSVFRYQHGAMMKLYEHDSGGCGGEPCNINFKCVAPISILIFYCHVKWMQTIQLKSEKDITCKYSKLDHCRFVSCEGRSFRQTTRKIYRSEDIGFVLFGNLKISTPSGRLQLVDVSGGIDVMVPDLPSTWNTNGIYEVTKYSLVIEGIPQMEKYLANQSFSCRNFFHSNSLERDLKVTIYVYFHFRNATCRNLPIYSCIDHGYDFEMLNSGTYHLLQITHKFPILQKFQSKQLVPSTSHMYVEAVIYSWNLFLTGRDKGHLRKPSMKQPMEDSRTANCQKHADKRLKTDHSSWRVKDADKVYDIGVSSCGFNVSFDNYKGSTEEQKFCNLGYHRISCLATVRSPKHGSQDLLGFLFNTRSKSSSGDDTRSSAQRVLLEFEPESILKYQFLQIGNYYITKHHREHPLCNIKESNCVNGHKFFITSSTHLWGISFTFDDDLLHSIVSNHSQSDDFSISDIGEVSGDQIDVRQGTFSNIYLHLPENAKNLLVLDSQKQEKRLIKPALKPKVIGNMSPCGRNATSSVMQTSVLCPSECLFPEGNLSTLHGYVVAVHNVGHSCIDSDFKCQRIEDGSLCRFFLGGKRSLCIHLLVDDHIVKIFGSLKNYTFPVGFGPGVNATFHRVLELGDLCGMMLAPLSFIEINSFGEFKYSLSEMGHDSTPSLETISLQLFSEMIYSHCKSMKFRCRVVAINILVLEKYTDHGNLQFELPHRQPLVSIPLAGFMLDDGSSKSNCWTSGEKAATLLRLHDPLPPLTFAANVDWTLKRMVHNSHTTASYHLERVLKNRGRIIVRSCGSIFDSYQDLNISFSSDDALSSADEDLIKLILVNACFGAVWTIIGSQLEDSDAVQSLLKGYVIESELVQPHHIWVNDVYCTNTLNEARDTILELMNE